MKTTKYNIILLAMVLFFTGCYKDNSNTTINPINPIVIDNSVQTTNITAFQLDTIHVTPVIYKNGVADSNLKYEWTLSGEGIVPTVMGNSMTLHAVMFAPPKGTSYNLNLTVTDLLTSIQNSTTYYVTVLAQLGNGLMVADTRDGGQTSDISLVRAQNFSGGNYDARKNRVFSDVFSSVNLNKIDGKVKGMLSADYYGDNRYCTIFTDNTVLRVNPYDFAITESGNGIFFVPIAPEDFKFNGIAYVNTYAPVVYINANGLLYPHRLKFGTHYEYKIPTQNGTPYNITMMSQSGLSYEFPVCFDNLNKRFTQIDGSYTAINVFDGKFEGAVFNINNVGAYSPVYMGRGQIGNRATVHNIMKSDVGDKYYCYVMDYATLEPLRKYDLNSCEGITEAVAFECNPKEDVLYYATKDGIYSSLTSQVEVLTSRKTYTPAQGEEITGMSLWRAYGWQQGNVRIKDENTADGYSVINATNRMMIISTYNQATKEGKIITIPITNLGSGELESDKTFHIEYKGFGEIIKFEQQCV